MQALKQGRHEAVAAMDVHVRLFSRFREHLPREARGQATIELPDGTTVEQLIAHLGIARRVRLVVVNDEREPDRNRALRDGDCVKIFPVVVGG
jgi:molybdopterin converting factor small subunit